MIDNSSSVSVDKVPVQVDNQTVQKESISKVADTEAKTPEQVVADVKDTENSPLTREKVEEAVASLNAFVQLMDRNVSFAIDQESGRDIISVYEKETKELIRQIPSEETLELLKRMDNMVGVLFSENV